MAKEVRHLWYLVLVCVAVIVFLCLKLDREINKTVEYVELRAKLECLMETRYLRYQYIDSTDYNKIIVDAVVWEYIDQKILGID